MTEQSQVIDKLHGINVYQVHLCTGRKQLKWQIIILIQNLEVSLPWNTCVVCLLLLDVLCASRKNYEWEKCTLLWTSLKISVWCWETPEMSDKKKKQVQKITCKFACFLSSGLGVVDLGKCNANGEVNAGDGTRCKTTN